MIALPRREATKRNADERNVRAARIRLVLGSVEGWPEDWRVELGERLGIAEDVAETEVVDAFRSQLLRRTP